MNSLNSGATKSPVIDPNDTQLLKVQQFWNEHIHDWKIAKSPAGTKEFFDEIEAYRFEKLHYLPRLVDFNGYPGKKILDVGCGVGNDLSRFCKGGSEVFGIDIAPHSIELANLNFFQRGLKGEFLVMNGEQMTFPDDSFDVVYCHTVLHFTPRPEKMIAEIRRVLKPGGTAILMTVNRRSWLNILHKVMNVKIDHLDSPVFFKYTAREFGQMLTGFGDLRIVPERFPFATKVHGGLKAKLFNTGFVGLYNALPKFLTRRTGHHLMAFGTKLDAD